MNEVVSELRRTRRSHRMQDQEWFEVVYRVYLAALLGGSAIVLATDRVDDAMITANGIDEIRDRGPAVLGLIAVVAVAAGLRSGSNGGPIAVERADVRHLLLAPIRRTDVLRRPVVQRLRTLTFAGGVVGAVAGLLAARRLPGSTATWIATAALAVACAVVLFGAVAVLAHALRVPLPASTAVGLVLVGWQLAAASGAPPGPGDVFGGLAMWGLRRQPVELVAVLVTIGLVTAAVTACGRLRVDALTRRAELVSQLRFAVTMQDLRTVVVLRRQLRNEHPRRVPWWHTPRRAGSASVHAAVRRRDWHSLARLPLARIARTLLLALSCGLAAVVVLRGTTPAIGVLGVLLFAMSLELLEPLSQEIDHPDRTDALPVGRDRILADHLTVPALVTVPFALAGAAVVAVFEPVAAPAAFAVCIPMAWVGACGAVVSTVRDAPDPVARNAPWTPPEFAGFGTAMRVLIPVAVSTLGALPVLVLRESPTVGTAARSIVALLLGATACGWWVARRERWRAAIRTFLDPAAQR